MLTAASLIAASRSPITSYEGRSDAARGSRLACDSSGGCLVGCVREAIYSSRYDFNELNQFPNFRLVDRRIMTHIGQEGSRVFVDVLCDDGMPDRFWARQVLVGAGAPAPTALALDTLGANGKSLRK